MSTCICPEVGPDGIYGSEQKKFVAGFLRGLAEDGHYAAAEWSLLSLQDIYYKFGGMQVLIDTVPFRGGSCGRSRKCCGECTRSCSMRCVQDCLHRLYMWNQMVKHTPEAERHKLPLALRLIVEQKFESHQQLAVCVGEILSRHTNTELAKYMEERELSQYMHPYRNDYSPSVVIDPATGKRKTNPETGEISYRNWPETGLCPYCLPRVMVDGHATRRRKHDKVDDI